MNRVQWIVWVCFSLVLLGSAPAVVGETETDDTATRQERFADLIKKKQEEGAVSKSGNMPQLQAPFTPGGVGLSAENKDLQQQAVSEYFMHIMESNKHQLRVFHWQLLSAKVIFVTVILLVISGIYFAAVQFHHGLRKGEQSGDGTEFEASLKGIRVSSPVLGVIILTISLAFFYLYLVYIYPIELVRG